MPHDLIIPLTIALAAPATSALAITLAGAIGEFLDQIATDAEGY